MATQTGYLQRFSIIGEFFVEISRMHCVELGEEA
jgi:hypothetical protein